MKGKYERKKAIQNLTDRPLHNQFMFSYLCFLSCISDNSEVSKNLTKTQCLKLSSFIAIIFKETRKTKGVR